MDVSSQCCLSPCLSCSLTILTKTELTSQLCKVLVSDIEKIFWPGGLRWGDTGGGKGNRAIKASSSQLLIFNWLAISLTLFSILPPRTSGLTLDVSLCNYSSTTTIKNVKCSLQTFLYIDITAETGQACHVLRDTWKKFVVTMVDHRVIDLILTSAASCETLFVLGSKYCSQLTASCFSHSFHGIKLPTAITSEICK